MKVNLPALETLSSLCCQSNLLREFAEFMCQFCSYPFLMWKFLVWQYYWIWREKRGWNGQVKYTTRRENIVVWGCTSEHGGDSCATCLVQLLSATGISVWIQVQVLDLSGWWILLPSYNIAVLLESSAVAVLGWFHFSILVKQSYKTPLWSIMTRRSGKICWCMESFTCVIKASNAASIAYVNTTEKYCRGVKAGDEKMNMRINTQVLMPKRWHRLHPGLWK